MQRLRVGCAAVLAVAASTFATAPAHASAQRPAFEPLDSNRPHLAWRGEDVKLVHCAPTLTPDSTPSQPDGSIQYDAVWTTLWSRSDAPAPDYPSGTRFVVETAAGSRHQGRQCVQASVTSEHAGLARLQLDIRNQATGASLLKRQFLVGWLNLKQVKLDDGFGGTTVFDGPGWGSYNWLRARVYGTLPLGGGFSEIVQPTGPLPAVIQLPAESSGSPAAGQGDTTTWYDDLAQILARTTSTDAPYRDQPWLMWDVHDDQTLAAGHTDADAQVSPDSDYSGPCEELGIDFLPVLDTVFDSVDNCAGGLGEEGPFSRIWPTLTSGLAVGPYDPLRPDATFLGDGRVTAGDVVMPSAPIDVAIEPNTGAPGDISGAGTLEALDKEDVYMRAADAGYDTAHNLYAPFYRSFIPSTRAELAGLGLASGTDAPWSLSYPKAFTCDPGAGPPQPLEDCSYAYWELENVLESVVGQDTGCLYRYRAGAPEYRPSPSGDQTVVVYSDEHGEAMVKYVPGWDFYFDGLMQLYPGVETSTRGCDLQDVSPLGTADITAIARYPGQSVLDPDKVSNVLTESTYNSYLKDVTCAPKGASGADRIAYICTAQSIDIDGTAMAQSKVCFSARGATSITSYPAGTPFTLDGVGQALHRDGLGRRGADRGARPVLHRERQRDGGVCRRARGTHPAGRLLVLPAAAREHDDDDHDDDHDDDADHADHDDDDHPADDDAAAHDGAHDHDADHHDDVDHDDADDHDARAEGGNRPPADQDRDGRGQAGAGRRGAGQQLHPERDARAATRQGERQDAAAGEARGDGEPRRAGAEAEARPAW